MHNWCSVAQLGRWTGHPSLHESSFIFSELASQFRLRLSSRGSCSSSGCRLLLPKLWILDGTGVPSFHFEFSARFSVFLTALVAEETTLLVGGEVGGSLELTLGVQRIVAAGELAEDSRGGGVSGDLVLGSSVLIVDEPGTGELAVRLGALTRWQGVAGASFSGDALDLDHECVQGFHCSTLHVELHV